MTSTASLILPLLCSVRVTDYITPEKKRFKSTKLTPDVDGSMATTLRKNTAKAPPAAKLSLGLLILALQWSSMIVHAQCQSSRKGFTPGDISIGYLLPVTSSSSNGFYCDDKGKISDPQRIQLLEAAIYSINAFEQAQGQSIRIGLEILDTCNSGQVSVEQTIAYLSGRASTTSGSQFCDDVTFKPVIIGHLRNDEAPGVASLLTDARVPVVSYAATRADLTTDEEYDFFFRNTPSDDDIGRALVGILKRMGWTYIALVTTDNSEDIAAGGTFRRIAESNGICVSVSHILPEGTTEPGDFDTALADVVANQDLNVVVLFTTSELARGLYQAAERQSATDIQWVAGHRTILDGNTLYDAPLVTRGLLGVSPQSFTSTYSDTFDDYFRNLTPENVNTTADPWFLDYWQQSLGCNISAASGATPQCGPTHAEEHRNSYTRNPYVTAAIEAVHLTLVAANSLRDAKCGASNPGLCSAFAMASPQEWQDAVQGARFYSSTVANYIGFQSDGSALNNNLRIVNMKGDTSTTTGYSLQEVGSWQDGRITFDPANVELWTGGVMQQVQSRCGVPCNDDACIATTDNGTMVYLSGDLIIGGLFSLHSWNETNEACGEIRREGILRLEAMMFILDQINNDDSILGDITLGMDGFDTCSNSLQAGLAVQNFIANADFGPSGSGERVTSDGSTELVYGVIGPEGDDELIAVNRVLHIFEVPLIAYESFSSTISNPSSFPNVARMTPVNYADTIPLARALANGGYKYVQVIYTSVFSSARSVFNSIGKQYGLCVSQEIKLQASVSQGGWDDLFTKLAARSDARVVVMLTDASTASMFLSQLQTRNLIGRYYLVGNFLFPVASYLQSNPDIIRGLTLTQRMTRTYPAALEEYLTGLRPETNVRNPWFAEFWMDHFQCRLEGYQSAFTNPCTGNEELTREDIFDTAVGDVIDATYTMARALDLLQRDLCDPGQVCTQMTASEGSDLFKKIASPLPFDSPLGDGRMLQFNSVGDIVATFFINNYQRVESDYRFVEIARYVSYGFRQTNNPIKVYDEGGRETESPVVECSGLCDECTIIDKGKTAYSDTQGDIWIGGFFDITEPEADQYTCSNNINDYNIQLLEAFLYAIDEVNSNSSILPSFTLAGVGFDTCGSAEKAQRETSNYVGGAVEYRFGYFPTSVSVAGIIGGQTSDGSLAIANVLNNFGVNQISYGASTTELSNDEDYPYFLRTIPSDAKQAGAMIDLITHFGWSYVSIVYSDSAYGQDISREFTDRAKKDGICIAMTLSIKTIGVVDFPEIITRLLANPQSKIVVLLTSNSHTKGILEAAESARAFDLQWIGGDTWGSRLYITTNARTVARGALIVELPNPAVEDFNAYFTGHTGYSNNRNPWWKDYIMDTFQCQLVGGESRFSNNCPSGSLDYSGKYTPASESAYIIDAVKAFAVGLDGAIKSLCPNLGQYKTCEDIYLNPTAVHNHIKRASFTGASGIPFSFDENGDGMPRYDIINIQGSSLQNSKVGSWENGVLQITPDSVEFHDGSQVIKAPQSECSGRCSECSQGVAVQPLPVQRQGQLQIPALFAAHSISDDPDADCGPLLVDGVVNAEAMLYAIDRINADNLLLPGITLGTSTFDTCQSIGRGIGKLSGFLSGSADTDHQPWYRVLGVLGGGRLEATSATALVAEQYDYTQVTYSSVIINSDSPVSQLSVAPSNNDRAQAIVELLLNYDWSYIGAIYDTSDYEQAQLYAAFEDVSRNRSICIGQAIMVTDSAPTIQPFQEDDDLNVVVIFAKSPIAKSVLDGASNSGGGRRLTFVLAFLQEFPDDDVTAGFVGTLAIFTPPPPAEFQQHFTSISATNDSASLWFVKYIEDRYNCEADGDGNYAQPCSGTERAPLDDVASFGGAAAYIIDSVNTIARGTHNLLEELCGADYSGLCADFLAATPQQLQRAISDVSFTGSEGKTVSFTDRVRQPQFDIWNGQEDRGSRDFVKVGSWEASGLTITSDSVQLFDTASNPGQVPSRCGGSCQSCNNVPLFSSLSGVQFYILIIVASVGALLTVLMMVMVIFRWKNPSAMGISPLLHLTLLLGIILLYALIPIYSSSPSAITCALQRIITGVAYAICYVSVFLLITRLYRMGLRERRITGTRAPFINNASQAVFFSIFILIEVAFLVQWLVQQPSTDLEIITFDADDSSTSSTAYCRYVSKDMAISLLYVYLLMAISLITAIQAWCSVKVVFTREFSIYIITVCLCICAMIAWIIAVAIVDRQFTHLVSSIGAIVQASLLLFSLVVPKVRLLCFGQHDEFWESASVTSSEYGGYPRASGDFSGVENPEAAGENNYETPDEVTHVNASYEDYEPDKSVGISKF